MEARYSPWESTASVTTSRFEMKDMTSQLLSRSNLVTPPISREISRTFNTSSPWYGSNESAPISTSRGIWPSFNNYGILSLSLILKNLRLVSTETILFESFTYYCFPHRPGHLKSTKRNVFRQLIPKDDPQRGRQR